MFLSQSESINNINFYFLILLTLNWRLFDVKNHNTEKCEFEITFKHDVFQNLRKYNWVLKNRRFTLLSIYRFENLHFVLTGKYTKVNLICAFLCKRGTSHSSTERSHKELSLCMGHHYHSSISSLSCSCFHITCTGKQNVLRKSFMKSYLQYVS